MPRARGMTANVRDGYGAIDIAAAIDIATVSGCNKLVVGPTHARGGKLDFMLTDVPDLVWVAVLPPFGNSDHSQSIGGHFDD